MSQSFAARGRRGEKVFACDPFAESDTRCRWADPRRDGDILNDHPATYGLDPAIRRAITTLLVARCPVAVAWVVWPVIVSALYKQTWIKRRAHVVAESLKGSAPPFADGDSPAAVVVKLGGSRVVTATDHIAPSGIQRGFREAVGATSHTSSIYRQAPATPAGATANCGGSYPALNATEAAAIKPTWFAWSGVIRYDSPAPKCLADRCGCTIEITHCRLSLSEWWWLAAQRVSARLGSVHFTTEYVV